MRTLLLATLLFFLPASGTALQAQGDDNVLPTLPGTIAYISTDYNVYTLHPETNTRVQLTEDGSETQPYIWPTWSTDGRLAYFLSVSTGRTVATEVYVSSDGGGTGDLIYDGQGKVFNYAYWSPQNCNEGEGCRDLAVLLSTIEGLGVELIRDGINAPTSRLIGRGAPFYYSWSPDGSRMLWQRNNQRMDIYDVEARHITETLPQAPGAFSAPAWSPVDDRLLFGALNGESGTTDLVIAANGETNILAPELEGVIYFAWSPDGNKVAYTSQQGPLMVVDAVTGDILSRSSVSGVLAFFWSPDSGQIAYITLAAPPGSISAKTSVNGSRAGYQEATGIAWSVMDIQGGNTRHYGSFIPTREMVYLFIYFDQFSQSHRIWSPDSRYLLYSEITAANSASINILDTSQTNVVPFSVAEGYIGIWSFS